MRHYDIVLFKLDSSGTTQWVQQQPSFNTTGINLNPSINLDRYGSIYVAYPTDGSNAGVPVTGPYDIVVFKMLTAMEADPHITCDGYNLYYVYFTNQGLSR